MNRSYKVVSFTPQSEFLQIYLKGKQLFAIANEEGEIIYHNGGYGIEKESDAYELINSVSGKILLAVNEWEKIEIHRNAIREFRVDCDLSYSLKNSEYGKPHEDLEDTDFDKIWKRVEEKFKLRIPLFLKKYYESERKG